MGSSERQRELRRRRHRKKKLAIIRRKLENANNADKDGLKQKIRALTPGAEIIIGALNLSD